MIELKSLRSNVASYESFTFAHTYYIVQIREMTDLDTAALKTASSTSVFFLQIVIALHLTR